MKKFILLLCAISFAALAKPITEKEFDAMMEVVPHIEVPVDDGVWFENLTAKEGELDFSPDDPNWTKTDRWRFVTPRTYKSLKPTAPTVTLYGEFEMPVAKKQAMSFNIGGTPGLSSVRVDLVAGQHPARFAQRGLLGPDDIGSLVQSRGGDIRVVQFRGEVV